MPEYVDYAEYYDAIHDKGDDVPFYLEYARRAGGPVLELACGTGRLAVPLAEAGLRVHGFDFSERMLDVLRRKIAKKKIGDRLSVSCANMADFDLPEKSFALAFVAFRSFMHLFTQADQLACLRRVFSHLRPGGRFIVDVYTPNLEWLSSPCTGEFVQRNNVALPGGGRLLRKDRFVRKGYVNQINEAELAFEEYDTAGGLVRSRTVPLATRYSFRFELQLLLEKAGFEIEALFGDYDKRPFDWTGEIIFVARKSPAPVPEKGEA